MAYTYDDFVSAARNAGLYDAFAQEDLVTAQKSPEYGMSLLKLQQDAGKATTEEQKLLVQEAVNQLRKTYGTTAAGASTGGGTGSSFSYGNETAYQQALGAAANPGSFQYDYRQDDAYEDLRQDWLKDSDRTADRVTGSTTVPQTSWATAAAQQSSNYQNAKLTDQIPGLRENAYQEYLGDQGIRQNQYGAVAGDKEFSYAAYLQQQQLDQQKAQQEFDNAMTLNKLFGTEKPTMPDLTGMAAGEGTGYQYGKAGEYQQALDAVLNQEGFSYDQSQDPIYAAARKSGLREGDRATDNALARLSARTGGVASSYGVRAAADAGNEFNGSVNGAAPDLRQNAYQEYLGAFDSKLQGLQTMENDRAFDYAGWLQNYQLQEAAKQQEFENAIALYKRTGHLTPEIAAVLGVPYRKASGGNGAPGAGMLNYNQIRDGYMTGLGAGRTDAEAAQFLSNAVSKGYISQDQAKKIASGYTAGERMWDRHG